MRVFRIVALAAAALAFCAVAPTAAFDVPLPPLPYKYDELEPVFSEKALTLHYSKHHQTYADKLAAALTEAEKDPSLAPLLKQGILKILQNIPSFPEKLRKPVTDNGGGFINHHFFWHLMRAPRDNNAPEPGSKLAVAIDATFGSFEAFKKAFSTAATDRFGSGYAWLSTPASGAQGAGTLELTSMANQDSPFFDAKKVPLLTVDVWEHSYYLDYFNVRASYVTDWWRLVNWPYVQQRYERALAAPATEAGTLDAINYGL